MLSFSVFAQHQPGSTQTVRDERKKERIKYAVEYVRKKVIHCVHFFYPFKSRFVHSWVELLQVFSFRCCTYIHYRLHDYTYTIHIANYERKLTTTTPSRISHRRTARKKKQIERFEKRGTKIQKSLRFMMWCRVQILECLCAECDALRFCIGCLESGHTI